MRFSARTMLPETPTLRLASSAIHPCRSQNSARRLSTIAAAKRIRNPNSPASLLLMLKCSLAIQMASMDIGTGPIIVTIPIPINRSRHPFMIGRQRRRSDFAIMAKPIANKAGSPSSVSFTTTPATPSRKQRYRKHCLRTEFGFASQPSCTTTTPSISSGTAAA